MSNNRNALGIIDLQPGFMPGEEGERLGLQGFGELPVPGGHEVVKLLNKLALSDVRFDYTFTTQDWHPNETLHFSPNPDFVTNWPVHCVADTPGADLHPDLAFEGEAFKKGQESLKEGEEDTSYSGYNATNEQGLTLPERLKQQDIDVLYLGGLALDYCLKATALDFRKKLGMKVIVLSDTTKPVTEESGEAATQELKQAGVEFMTVDGVIERSV